MGAQRFSYSDHNAGNNCEHANEFLNLRALNKIHIFQSVSKIFCVGFSTLGISEIPREISYPYFERYDFITMKLCELFE